MNKEFKVNDWVFCEFKLQQIQKVEEGRVTSVTDGMFNHSSWDMSDRCYHLHLRIKVASDSVTYWHDKFHQLKPSNLNYPDLHRALVAKWCELCDNIEDDDKMKELYEKLSEFGRKISDRVNELRYEEIDGVPLFRQ